MAITIDILSNREEADVIAAVGEVSYGRRHVVTPCRPTDTRDAAFGVAVCMHAPSIRGRAHFKCVANSK